MNAPLTQTQADALNLAILAKVGAGGTAPEGHNA